MDISDFNYDLPEERIAQVPVEPRDSSRLMVLNSKEHTIAHRYFFQLGDFPNLQRYTCHSGAPHRDEESNGRQCRGLSFTPN